MSHRRVLAPLVGAGMAAVAAGSLVLFSLLAQEAALSPPGADVLVPRGPVGAPAPDVTLPAPAGAGGTGPGSEIEPTTSLLPEDKLVLVASRSNPPEATETGAADETLTTVLAVKMKLAATLDFTGPRVGVSAPERPGEKDPDDPADPDGCPGRPNRDSARGEHPHGGPPACGNPHGGPPGYDKDAPGSSDNSSGGSGGRSGGGAHPHGGPPGSESTPPKSPPRPEETGGGEAGGDSQDNADHPHGAPPGQSKDASPGSGNPHGGPPGQAKKEK